MLAEHNLNNIDLGRECPIVFLVQVWFSDDMCNKIPVSGTTNPT